MKSSGKPPKGALIIMIGHAVPKPTKSPKSAGKAKLRGRK
jgi:hypothetical protein